MIFQCSPSSGGHMIRESDPILSPRRWTLIRYTNYGNCFLFVTVWEGTNDLIIIREARELCWVYTEIHKNMDGSQNYYGKKKAELPFKNT